MNVATLSPFRATAGIFWKFMFVSMGAIAFALPAPAIAADELRSLVKAVTALQQTIQTLLTRNSLLQNRVAALEASDAALQNEIGTYLRPLEPHVTVDTHVLSGLPGPHIIFTGANVHIRNGNGPLQGFSSAEGCPATGHCDGSGLTPYLNGVGNLIVGYDEQEPSPYPVQARTGSHNVVIGYGHQFTGHAGLVAGLLNTVTGASNTVSGGFQNTASGINTSVSGGAGNTATNEASSVCGGVSNIANGIRSSVSGGQTNVASGQSSSIAGGRDNEATGFAASISGGAANTASGNSSSVSGGESVLSSGDASWAAGSLRSPSP